MLTLEQKLKNLEIARQHLENAKEEIFEAGKLVDETMDERTKHYYSLRIEVGQRQERIKSIEKDLRNQKED